MIKLYQKLKIYLANKEMVLNLGLKKDYFHNRFQEKEYLLSELRSKLGKLNAIRDKKEETKREIMIIEASINEVEKLREAMISMTREQERATDYLNYLKESLWK
jgi:hypothetical protein